MFNQDVLTQKLEELRVKHNIAGMSVAVTDGDGVIYNQGFGFESAMRPDVPTHPDALYKIASMTKTVTTIMIMRLVESGILSLDEPIKNYLPWLTFSRPEAAETVTLKHLLTHASGLPDDEYMEEGSRDEDTIDSIVKATIPTLEMHFLPEEGKYCYSNWGFNLIGCVASRVTGKSISELLSEYVLKPLGMDRTTFDYHVASTYPLSLPHTFDENGNPQVIHHQRINTAYHAGAGLYSSTSDICKLARFFLRDGVSDSGERLISKELLTNMMTKHFERADYPGSYYGYGLFIHPFGDSYAYGHLGNYDPYNSSFFCKKEKNVAIVMMINSPVEDLRYEVPKMFFGMI